MFWSIILCLLAASAIARADPSSGLGRHEILGVRGTLVVAVATRDGLLISADRRTYDKRRGDRDTECKITQLSPSAACASTGQPLLDLFQTDLKTSQITVRRIFDADLVAANYFKQREFQDTDQFWLGLFMGLVREYDGCLRKLPFEIWPESAAGTSNTLFQTAVFFLDKQRRPKAVCIEMRYRKGIPPYLAPGFSVLTTDSLTKVTPQPLGNLAVYNELCSGSDVRFEDVRSDKLFARFLHGNPSVETVTVADAVRFSRNLIRITSERTHLIENTTFHVGRTTDVALLDYKTGFRWLEKHEVSVGNIKTRKLRTKAGR